jgi:serine/threonine protein kinase
VIYEAGYCHRDIKPDNIFIDEEFNLKLSDFGCTAKVTEGSGDGLFGSPKGTANFQAPEILEAR